MKKDLSKSKIYNICLNNINTVNSFVFNDSYNHFEPMINKIEQYIIQEIIGANEREAIIINGEKRGNKRAVIRNLFRREMRKKILTPLSELIKNENEKLY